MKKHTFVDPSRDLPLLEFLWKWKVCTTAALSARFYDKLDTAPAYNRLRRLERGGLLESIYIDQSKKHLWSLGPTGFKLILPYLPPLKESGYKSEFPAHDLLTGAFQIGGYLNCQPMHIDFFTEQQLRRYEPEFFPSWIPKSDRHRSDGYTRINNSEDKSTVAIEVELSIKKEADYEDVARYYDRYSCIFRVLWLVPNRLAAERIFHIIRGQNNSNSQMHSFVLKNDFEQIGWSAKIAVGGSIGQSVNQLLGGNAVDARSHDTANLFLDFRKCRTRFRRCLPVATP